MGDDIHTYVQTTIPKSLQDLMDSHGSIKQIAAYCRDAYASTGEQGKVYEQTQNYTKDALLNVAYHIQTIGSHIITLLELQANEIDKIDIQIRTLSDRMKTCHDATGAMGFRAAEGVKTYPKSNKVRKLEGAQLPETAKAPRKFVRQPISYGAVDSNPQAYVATQASNPGPAPPPRGPSFQPPSLSAPPPSLSAPPAFSAPPPPAFGSPSLSAPPPPPVDFGMPPPPPADFDLPPPPPFDLNDMPPPPPFGDLPPPPSFGMPPPPPPR